MTIYMVIVGELYRNKTTGCYKEDKSIRSAYTNKDAAKRAVACWRELYKDRELYIDEDSINDFVSFQDGNLEHYCFIMKVDAKHLFEGEEDLYLIQG